MAAAKKKVVKKVAAKKVKRDRTPNVMTKELGSKVMAILQDGTDQKLKKGEHIGVIVCRVVVDENGDPIRAGQLIDGMNANAVMNMINHLLNDLEGILNRPKIFLLMSLMEKMKNK